ncbi:MAG: FHA domain-containing protein [Planctomycetaceae bacterium]|nr:FHA domain-containing protein [Planctomycetaceae bacterium]
MDKQLVPMLHYAAGVGVPLRFDLTDPHGVRSTIEVAGPFAIAGRGDECDLTLKDPSIAFRQVYFQAIGNRVATMELFSATPCNWHGPAFQGWMSPENVLNVGGYRIQLTDSHWNADSDVSPPLEFRPRDERHAAYGPLPEVHLELTNTSARGLQWPINRVITLVGRDERCRITVADERVSRVHCALLLLPTGLWVIDLLGKGGIRVDGAPRRCSLLADGGELQIGPYKMHAHYPQIAVDAASAQLANQVVTGREFVTQQNRILQVETYQDTLIVLPVGDSQQYFYQDIYVESSRVMDLITSRKYQHVIIDFGQSIDIGHMVIEALASLCRSSTGASITCAVPPHLQAKLERTNLLRIWPNVPTRMDALQAVCAQA